MQQIKWFDRTFGFNPTENIFPAILERLSGTPLRVEEKLKSISPQILTERINNTWTIKENVGHLGDLEPLWQGRFEDIVTGQIELRAGDPVRGAFTLDMDSIENLDIQDSQPRQILIRHLK